MLRPRPPASWPGRTARRRRWRAGGLSWGRSSNAGSLQGPVLDQAQVHGVLAVFALEDAHRGGHAVGDPQDGFVVAAVGALHAQRLVAQAGHFHRPGGVRAPAYVVARAAAVDEAVL